LFYRGILVTQQNTVTVKNCVSLGASVDFQATNVGNLVADNCVSSDSTAFGTTKATSQLSPIDYFADPINNGDFHLKSNSLPTWGISGADLSGIFTGDMDGHTRTGTWDVGPDQYGSGVTATDFCWGETTPDATENKLSWTQWEESNGVPVTVTGDPDYGSMQIDSGTPCYSPVVQNVSGLRRAFEVVQNKYGSGSGNVNVYIRGSNSSFAKWDANPTWNLYSGETKQDWNYIQLKVEYTS
jgi:hypothetical protein